MSTRRLVSLLMVLLAAGLLLALAGCATRGYFGASYSSHGHHPAWVYGPRFHLGPSSFVVVHGSSRYSRGYFFRTRYLGPDRYCGRYCFSRRGHHYHHPSCRHLRGYVGRYGYRVDELVDRYGPRPYR